MIDWRKILLAYVNHVVEEEGISFLRNRGPVEGLTMEENAELYEAVASNNAPPGDYRENLLKFAAKCRGGG